MCVFCFQPGVSCPLISATSVRNTPQPGSLTQTSVHALGSGMAAAVATPTALERNMNVSRHVGTRVSPDCTQADRSTSVDPLTSAISGQLTGCSACCFLLKSSVVALITRPLLLLSTLRLRLHTDMHTHVCSWGTKVTVKATLFFSRASTSCSVTEHADL